MNTIVAQKQRLLFREIPLIDCSGALRAGILLQMAAMSENPRIRSNGFRLLFDAGDGSGRRTWYFDTIMSCDLSRIRGKGGTMTVFLAKHGVDGLDARVTFSVDHPADGTVMFFPHNMALECCHRFVLPLDRFPNFLWFVSIMRMGMRWDADTLKATSVSALGVPLSHAEAQAFLRTLHEMNILTWSDLSLAPEKSGLVDMSFSMAPEEFEQVFGVRLPPLLGITANPFVIPPVINTLFDLWNTPLLRAKPGCYLTSVPFNSDMWKRVALVDESAAKPLFHDCEILQKCPWIIGLIQTDGELVGVRVRIVDGVADRGFEIVRLDCQLPRLQAAETTE